jgi:small GTP-binding protein
MDTMKFEILDWATQAAALLERSRRILLNEPSEKVRTLAERIPLTLLSDDGKVKVVFAGQYSAGKSTILRALTGREDIAVGAGIVTQEAATYEWEGVSAIDTPGIHTEIRPDHDALTYRAIADADLLVFVITNELFDARLADHFRKLAIERDKAHEMMLVVNKMRRHALGNTSTAQNVIREDLQKVLSPFSPEDLRTSFVDAKAAMESKTKLDEAMARMMWRKSGFDGFVAQLNQFVRDKGLTARYTTSLYALEQVLQEALAAESTGDKDVDALEELLLQRRRALLETQQHILRGVEAEVHRTVAQVKEEGRRASELIHASADDDKLGKELEAAQNRVQIYAEKLTGAIELVVAADLKKLDDRLGDIINSELSRELLPHLAKRLDEHMAAVRLSPETQANLKHAANVSGELGKFLVHYSFKGEVASFAGIFRLRPYSGTAAHDAVKAIGHFFGKSFRPWEAVKWARTVANVGRVLAVAGTFLTVVLQWKEDADAAQMERDLRESRSAVRGGFNEAAHAIELHFDKATGSYIADTLTPAISEVDQQLDELRQMQQARGKLFQEVLDLLEETRSLISMLHVEAT